MEVEYNLTRSKRKTMAIHIRDGVVEVRVPLGLPKGDIDRFVAAKEKWITQHLAESKERAERKKEFELTYGDKVVLRGKNYPIKERPGNKLIFDGESLYLPSGLKPADIKDNCIRLYRDVAKNHLAERVAVYAEKMKLKPAAVKINGARTRWGSCSSNGNINFSWRLIMAPEDVIDYVVVHELAHFFEMNHSAKFWATVNIFMPDYEARRERLKELQKRLAEENW